MEFKNFFLSSSFILLIFSVYLAADTRHSGVVSAPSPALAPHGPHRNTPLLGAAQGGRGGRRAPPRSGGRTPPAPISGNGGGGGIGAGGDNNGDYAGGHFNFIIQFHGNGGSISLLAVLIIGVLSLCSCIPLIWLVWRRLRTLLGAPREIEMGARNQVQGRNEN